MVSTAKLLIQNATGSIQFPLGSGSELDLNPHPDELTDLEHGHLAAQLRVVLLQPMQPARQVLHTGQSISHSQLKIKFQLSDICEKFTSNSVGFLEFKNIGVCYLYYLLKYSCCRIFGFYSVGTGTLAVFHGKMKYLPFFLS